MQATELSAMLSKMKTQKIVRERTLSMQIASNDQLITEYSQGIQKLKGGGDGEQV